MVNLASRERLALGVVALLVGSAALGRALQKPAEVDVWEESPEALDRQTRRAEGEGARDRLRGAPLAADERIDPNVATEDQLQRLPRVGPKLAAQIVAHREAKGPFRTLADLDAVPGIGPALLANITPHVTLPPAPAQARTLSAGQTGSAGAQPVSVQSAAAPVDINAASATELQALPGIGPTIAERIVAWRTEHGKFASVEELQKVSGIGAKKLERIRAVARAGP